MSEVPKCTKYQTDSVCVCVCVCVCARAHVHIHASTHAREHARTHTHTHTHNIDMQDVTSVNTQETAICTAYWQKKLSESNSHHSYICRARVV